MKDRLKLMILLGFIRNDAAAITYQSLKQYREELIRRIMRMLDE
jgi:hypothetical protein